LRLCFVEKTQCTRSEIYVCDTTRLKRRYGTQSHPTSVPGVETPGYYRASSGRFFLPNLGERLHHPHAVPVIATPPLHLAAITAPQLLGAVALMALAVRGECPYELCLRDAINVRRHQVRRDRPTIARRFQRRVSSIISTSRTQRNEISYPAPTQKRWGIQTSAAPTPPSLHALHRRSGIIAAASPPQPRQSRSARSRDTSSCKTPDRSR
jgi:hypothetical protein